MKAVEVGVVWERSPPPGRIVGLPFRLADLPRPACPRAIL